MNDFDRDRENEYPVLSYLKTGARIPLYKKTGSELVEWKCPNCMHRWWEYSDEQEYPLCCPLCGVTLGE